MGKGRVALRASRFLHQFKGTSALPENAKQFLRLARKLNPGCNAREIAPWASEIAEQ